MKRPSAQNRVRGAFMDGIDEPLNNAAWLRAQFRTVRDLPDEAARLVAIVRASYSGRTNHRMRLMANNQYLISDKIKSRDPVIQEYAIPREATAGGKVELEWSAGPGERSCEVAEVWLIKQRAAP